jgi:hypothetical protein
VDLKRDGSIRLNLSYFAFIVKFLTYRSVSPG